MTEAEWLACEDPVDMLLYLRGPDSLREEADGSFIYRIEVDAPGRTSKRKLRLAACACCRRIWDLLPERSQELIEVNEQFAEGVCTADLLASAWSSAAGTNAAARDAYAAMALPSPRLVDAADAVVGLREWLDVERFREIIDLIRRDLSESYVLPELIAQCEAIRDIVGNLFRPAAVDPAWLTSDVLLLARGIYEEKAFDRMPILADALQDAGCTNDDVLNHCRGDGPHVRGCWVLDLLLGKE